MPTIYDIDFSQQGPEILPPDKRDKNTIGLVQSLLSACQWVRDLVLGTYKTGSTAPSYAAGPYNKFDQVIFEKSVYYSLIDNNMDDPTISTSWQKIQENFIGVDERMKFNGQVLVLEYALNKRFGGTFRPPGSSSRSDIYLQNIPVVVQGFLVGQTEPACSSVGQTLSSDTIGLRFPFVHVFNFQINFLASLYAVTNEQAVRDFTNLYVPSSLTYTIVTY